MTTDGAASAPASTTPTTTSPAAAAPPRPPPPRCHGQRSGAGSASAAADVSLARSRAYCERLTRAKARNFYYGLRLLPEPKRSDMFALYAYMRLIDDIADEDDGDGPAAGPVPPSHGADSADVGSPAAHARGAAQTSRPGASSPRAVLHGDARFAAGTGHEIWPAFADMARRHRPAARVCSTT